MERNQTEYDRDMTDAVSASLAFKQHVKHQNKTENLHTELIFMLQLEKTSCLQRCLLLDCSITAINTNIKTSELQGNHSYS